MSKIKKLIIWLVFITIVLISLIILLSYNNNKIESGDEEIEEDNENKKIELVLDNSEFYTIENCIKKYEAYINLDYKKQTTELNMPSLAAIYKISSQNEKNKAILNFLDEEYCEKNNIDENNVDKNIDETNNEDIIVSAQKINHLISENKNVDIYAVYAIKEDNINKNEKFYIVKIDNSNYCFSIIPLDNDKYKTLDEINIHNTTTYIEKNLRNAVIKSNINDSQIAYKYFEKFKTALLNNVDEAYKMLNEEYRNIRFKNIENFKEYVNDNINEFQLLQALEYSKIINEDCNQYIVKDAKNNVIIFDEKSPNHFTIKLDTYTIPTENFKETYNKSENDYKGQMNIDKFFQMINRQDYTTAYSCLAQSFKNNYFKTEEQFKEYVKNNFFTYNKVTYQTYEQKGSNIYTYKINLEDITKESTAKKEVKIIMQINENFDFEMSFSM